MSSVRRRGLAAASLAVTATLALSGCGTSFGAQTNQVYQPAVGANARGEVDVLGALLVGNTDGSATISAGLINKLDRDQTLSSVTATTRGGDSLEVVSPSGPLTLPRGELARLGADGPETVFVVQDVTPGAYVTITFTFSGSTPLTIEAPAVARTAEYASIAGADSLAPDDLSGEAEAETAAE